MKQLSQRQETILRIIEEYGPTGVHLISEKLHEAGLTVSRATLNRDLKSLEVASYIERTGVGKATEYLLPVKYNLIRPVDVESYIRSGQRNKEFRFNFHIFDQLLNDALLESHEVSLLEEIKQRYQQKIKKLQPGIIKRELERLTIDLSWKSSVIEGNTYDLLETETLLKEGIRAAGKSEEDAVMLLNHKSALEYIQANRDNYVQLSVDDIFKIHDLLTIDLRIAKGIRKSPVGITGTNYEPLSSVQEISRALNSTCDVINQKENPFEKALLALFLIAYIQPFVDGNKRTSRMLANALLFAGDSFPLSFRSIQVSEYKKAVLIFYEINNISYFKQLFIEQYKFAAEEYFHID